MVNLFELGAPGSAGEDAGAKGSTVSEESLWVPVIIHTLGVDEVPWHNLPYAVLGVLSRPDLSRGSNCHLTFNDLGGPGMWRHLKSL